MKRRNLTAAAIAFGACLMIVDVATPSARLCAAEPQSFSEDILPISKADVRAATRAAARVTKKADSTSPPTKA